MSLFQFSYIRLGCSAVAKYSPILGIPVGKLDRDEKATLMRLEDDITRRVKGQDAAVKSVSRAIRRARSGLRDQTKPVATFLFCGPTG